ncbi:hypothetical protein HHX47_DHR3000804, partial [Lentinula edodes]
IQSVRARDPLTNRQLRYTHPQCEIRTITGDYKTGYWGDNLPMKNRRRWT